MKNIEEVVILLSISWSINKLVIRNLTLVTALERVFTREISSRDEVIPVYGEMSLTVYTLLPR